MDFLIVLALGVGLFWLLTSRQRKAQRETANFRAELGPGDSVMTGSGLFGTVVEIDGDVITLETSPGVTTQWLRAAISKQASPEDHTAVVYDDEDEDEDAEEYDEEYGEYDDEEYDEEDEESDEASDDEPAELEVPDDASSITDDGTEKR